MRLASLGVAAFLTFLAYYLINLVFVTFCTLPGCPLLSVGFTLFIFVAMWFFILFNKAFY